MKCRCRAVSPQRIGRDNNSDIGGQYQTDGMLDSELFGPSQGALSGIKEEQGAVDHAVCAVQHLDGQTGAYAKGAVMSASANRQRVENQVKITAMQPLDGTIGADLSSCGKYPFMPIPQTYFRT